MKIRCNNCTYHYEDEYIVNDWPVLISFCEARSHARCVWEKDADCGKALPQHRMVECSLAVPR